nr:hypothetical protein [Tissierella sp.]
MDFVNKKVTHEIFGKGSVVNCSDSYIKINFESGDKRFSFPDAFSEYITFTDEDATDIVNKKIEIREEEREKEKIILEKERALEQERQDIINQNKRIKSGKVSSEIQSVFWIRDDEKEEVFEEWKVFTGKIKSGNKKGEPRKLPRMNKSSACLLTERGEDVDEADRKILGVFMVNDFFDGRNCEDGWIKAHPNYRLQLTEEESEKMLFWNYYVDKKSSEKTIWNSGNQRYFDNIWMAQILFDIVNLRAGDEEEKEYAQAFFEYFCKVNFINKDELPKPNGALMIA